MELQLQLLIDKAIYRGPITLHITSRGPILWGFFGIEQEKYQQHHLGAETLGFSQWSPWRSIGLQWNLHIYPLLKDLMQTQSYQL